MTKSLNLLALIVSVCLCFASENIHAFFCFDIFNRKVCFSEDQLNRAIHNVIRTKKKNEDVLVWLSSDDITETINDVVNDEKELAYLKSKDTEASRDIIAFNAREFKHLVRIGVGEEAHKLMENKHINLTFGLIIFAVSVYIIKCAAIFGCGCISGIKIAEQNCGNQKPVQTFWERIRDGYMNFCKIHIMLSLIRAFFTRRWL
ncbi:MAG: hypothetical protein LBL71_03625 [Endomicrobium sp.]|jgi:hypothetical protein|nr:hypothetical protein [Endomicrobium sp.]